MGSLNKIATIISVTLLLLVLNAIVIYWLWNWIVVKIFTLGWISMPQAFGLQVLISFLRSKRQTIKLEEDESDVDAFLKISSWSFTNSFFFLILGWIISYFI